MVKHIRMASLSEQMEQLQKQKEALALKMKEEEALKMKESYTIERLEVLNTGACNRRQQLGRKERELCTIVVKLRLYGILRLDLK